MAIGAPEANSPTGTASGAVYLYNLATGRLIRKVYPDSMPSNAFGFSIDMDGDHLVVGFGDRVYFFRLSSGSPTQNAVFEAPDVFPARTNFGRRVRLQGNVLVIGSTDPNDFRVFVYNLSVADSSIREFEPSTVEFGFGAAFDFNGRHLVVGAYAADGPSSESSAGKAFLFDLHSQTEVPYDSVQDSGPSANAEFGRWVQVLKNGFLVGAPGSNVVRNFDYSGNLITSFQPPQQSVGFGFHFAYANGRLAVGSPDTLIDSTKRGSCTLFDVPDLDQPKLELVAGFRQAADADLAFPQASSLIGNITDASVGPNQRIGFRATITGSGSRGGFNNGVFSGLPLGDQVEFKFGGNSALFNDYSVQTVGTPNINNASSWFLPVRLHQQTQPSPIVTQTNRDWILRSDGIYGWSRVISTGPHPSLNSEERFASFGTLSSPRDDSRLEVTLPFKVARGPGGAQAANDSGLIVVGRKFGPETVQQWIREGVSTPESLTETYGQFPGRVASFGEILTFTAALQESAASENAGLFRTATGSETSGTTHLIARKGGPSNLPSSPLFRSFVDETNEGTMSAARVTLTTNRAISSKDSAVTSKNNEAIFSSVLGNPSDLSSVIRKSDFFFSGGQVSRLIKFWPCGEGGVLVQVRLRGAGISARNDVALAWRSHSFGFLQTLLQEGDSLGTSDGARIGTIQRVDVDVETGEIAILASLTGGERRANQVLLIAFTSAVKSFNDSALLRPELIARKNLDLQLPSLSFQERVDRGGAGGKGWGQILAGKRLLLSTARGRNVRELFFLDYPL